jgi:hypothetical protein
MAFCVMIIAFRFFYDNKMIETLLCILITVTILGFCEVLRELKKSNKEVIVRDPKTGRFKKNN